MINIVHPLFRSGLLSRNAALAIGLALPPALCPLPAAAGFLGSVPCNPERDCPGHRPPGPPDRDVRPFDGTLGRPCAYRWRFSPQGTRRIRVCF